MALVGGWSWFLTLGRIMSSRDTLLPALCVVHRIQRVSTNEFPGTFQFLFPFPHTNLKLRLRITVPCQGNSASFTPPTPILTDMPSAAGSFARFPAANAGLLDYPFPR